MFFVQKTGSGKANTDVYATLLYGPLSHGGVAEARVCGITTQATKHKSITKFGPNEVRHCVFALPSWMEIATMEI